MMVIIIIIVIITIMMIIKIKIILIIVVVIIINSPFQPGNISTGSTTVSALQVTKFLKYLSASSDFQVYKCLKYL